MTAKKQSTQDTPAAEVQTIGERLSTTDVRHMTYEEILQQAAANNQRIDRVESAELIGGEDSEYDKNDLVRSPFIITSMTFRPSDKADAEYVSLEIKSKDVGNAIVNDSSTGIRRQAMLFCVEKGYATLTAEGKELYNEARKTRKTLDVGDLPVGLFDWSGNVDIRFNELGDQVVRVNDVTLWVPKGLRKSTYTTDVDGKKISAVTFYLA